MGPEELRRFLERLGPTFIKVGQFLALRPDLIAQEYCDELLGLLDRVPPFPAGQARGIVARELGRDPLQVFATFSPTPLASGSLAQVHRARLADGQEVAVKVLRPGIEGRVERDLGRLRLLARLLQVAGAPAVVSPREVVAELSTWLRQETDLARELANLERLFELTRGDPAQRVPRPYPGYSTARVLVTEYLPGVPVSEVLRELRAGDAAAERRLAGLDFDGDRLARQLILACLTQVFRYRFFHADLHPGNLLVLPGEVVGFVDFGLCAELAPEVREKQLRYLSAVYSGETERIFKAVSELLVAGPGTDPEAFRQDFLAVARDLELGTGERRGGERSPMGRYLVGVMGAARRHGLQVPAGILALYRTLLTVETVAAELSGGQGLRTVGQEFFRRLQREELLDLLDEERLQPMLLSALNLVREAPAQLSQVLAEMAEGSYTLKAYVDESARTRRARDRRARLWAASLVAISLAVLLTLPDPPRLLGVSLRWPVALLLAGVYGVIVALWRRLD
jgi:ubiquinone biosynthesis protein